MSDPILLFLAVDAAGLLLLGLGTDLLPPAAATFLAAMLSGLGMLLCLPPLLISIQSTALDLPIGPPGLSLQLALDPLSAFFLIVVFLSGTALAAFHQAAIILPVPNPQRTTAGCLAGAVLSLLAADGVTLAIGLGIMCCAIWLPHFGCRDRPAPMVPRLASLRLLVPLLLLAAICLLTPSGFAPRFNAIRAAPVDPLHATTAAALTFAAAAALICSRPLEQCWTRDALAAGVLIPVGSYLLLRFIIDLAGTATQAGCGFGLLLAGGAIAVVQGWRAASHPDIDGSVIALARRQAGLSIAGIGLALIARLTDLPAAQALALAATFLAALGGSVAGVLTSLAALAISDTAGTRLVSRLGGLVHPMPATSAALATGLLGLSAIPPGLGFASLWLLFEAILSAPRTGGLLLQLPLALIGAALALSTALATAATMRLIGVTLLGRPRTPQGSATEDNSDPQQDAGTRNGKSPARDILLAFTAALAVVGVLPGLALWLLADPAVQALTGSPSGTRLGLALLLPSVTSPSYLALPVAALLGLATGAAIMATRRPAAEGKAAGLWADGMTPPASLPFGEPAAQSVGHGFLPTFPALPLPRMPRRPMVPPSRAPSARAALWFMLAAFGTLLLLLAAMA